MRLLAILLLTFGLSSPSNAQPKSKATPVGVAKTVSLSAKTKIELSGTVIPWAVSHLASEIDGRVKQLSFNEGQYVKQGALLVQLDTHPLELERALAIAEKRRVATRLEELNAGSRSETIEAATAAVEKTKVRLEMTQIELQRIEQLYKEGVISVHDYDNMRALNKEALAQFKEKNAGLKEVLAGPRIEEIRQEEASFLAAERRIHIIEDQINRASILAPFDGSVAKKETEVGQWLDAGDPALTIIAIDPLKVEVHLPQYHFNEVELGTPAKIILQSSRPNTSNETFQGTVIEKIYSGDSASRTFPVRIKVHQTRTKIAPGMLVRVEFSPKNKSSNSLYVPKDAVVRTPKATAVWVARPNKDKVMNAVKVMVKTGKQVDSLIAVKPLKGKLQPGEWVIVQGNERLRPNMKIKIQKKF